MHLHKRVSACPRHPSDMYLLRKHICNANANVFGREGVSEKVPDQVIVGEPRNCPPPPPSKSFEISQTFALLSGTKMLQANAIWGTKSQNAAYLAAIYDSELRFRATTGGRVAIWVIA